MKLTVCEAVGASPVRVRRPAVGIVSGCYKRYPINIYSQVLRVPRFADLFIEELRRKRAEVLRVIGCDGGIESRYRDLVEGVWRCGVEARREFDRVFAVDSSSDEIEVAGGGVILVTRALALGADGSELRGLRVDAFFPRDVRDYEDFKRLLREHLEHRVALEALEEGADLILVDGSLFGRMSHVLRELRVEGREGFMLDYVETYGELLSRAGRGEAIVAGVSKESRSTVLREELLLSELRRSLETVDRALAERALEQWRGLRRRPAIALEEVRRLEREGLDPRVYELFKEVRNSLPDTKLLLAMNLDPGFTLPLKLGLEGVSTSVADVALSDASGLVEAMRRVFESTYDEMGSERVERALGALRSYPSVLTSYAIFSRGDDPLRVDMALDSDVPVAHPSRFVAEVPESFLRVLRHLACLYAGRRCYNVLLLEADRRVRVELETMELYRRLAMMELGELIVHSRGERRVWFP